jgi:hypothetical protein
MNKKYVVELTEAEREHSSKPITLMEDRRLFGAFSPRKPNGRRSPRR